MVKARINLILKSPFFGSLIMHLKPEQDDNCPTMWTDGNRIGYDEKFVDSLSHDELTGVLAHEVMHCALQHMTRRERRDPIIWNVAGDYAINLIVIKEFTLPKKRCLDDKYEGMSVDEIYNILYKQAKEQQENDGSGKSGSGQGGLGLGTGNDPGGCGEVRDASIAEKGESEKTWKVAVVQAMNNARKAGRLPGDIARLIGEVVHPKVAWRQLLRRFIEMTAKNDYTWSQPNRRYAAQGLYLPSLRSEELRNIAIAIDTSCSIGDSELNQFSAELNEIVREFKLEVDVIYCDSKVQGTQHFDAYDEIKLKPKGGGGTSFSPVFTYIDKKCLMPKCLIYLTDLESSGFPKSEPEYSTLWVKTGSHGEKPPFGEVVNLN